MNSPEWPKRSISELCRVTRGASPRPIIDWIAPSGVPWIKISDATASKSRTILSTREFIRPEGADRSVRVFPGDLIVSNSATPGLPKFVGLDACIHDGWLLFRDFDGVVPEFLYYRLLADRDQLVRQGNGSVFTNLKTEILKTHIIAVPPLAIQEEIAATLGAMDEKVESIVRARTLLRELGVGLLTRSIAEGTSQKVMLGELTTSISRGITPKYVDGDMSAPLILNQKCVRGGWVVTGQARRTADREVPTSKRVESGDILVNSTGTGTLGRVGRWHFGSVFADSHVSIVKPDPIMVGPTILAYALFGREPDIEAMATGSTGQTELSPSRLGELEVELPRLGLMPELESTLLAIENRVASLFAEEQRLVSLRDALLPELLSGRAPLGETLAVTVGVSV